jgi:SNF2 family DNA or RNA helicase
MSKEQGSFISRTKQRFAEKVAPIHQVELVRIGEMDLALSKPLTTTLTEFDFSRPLLSQNFTIRDEHITISADKDLNLLEKGGIWGQQLLEEVKLEDNKKFQFPPISIISETLQPILIPKILEPLEIYVHNEEDFQYHNEDMQIKPPGIAGKNYAKEKESAELNLFTGTTEDFNRAKSNGQKVERQYTKNEGSYKFDVFDIIFPSLQPPLGQTFNNPITFPHALYPFQVEGIQFLMEHKAALLGDETGLGKSIQTITAARVLFREGEITSACIVCPKAVMSDWEKKLWDWAPELKVIKIDGTPPARHILWNTPSHFYICTFETLSIDLNATLNLRNVESNEAGHTIHCPNENCRKRVTVPFEQHYKTATCLSCSHTFSYPFYGDIARTSFDLIVYDEIQKAKNPKTNLSKASRILFSSYRWGLSATPLENKMEDLITICETLKPNMFNGVSASDTARVIRTYNPIFLRRKSRDVSTELPEKVTEEIWLDLSESQRAAYDMAEREGIVKLKEQGESVTITHVLALITSLKQICNIDPSSGQSPKLDFIMNELSALAEQGNKALIFSQYPNHTLTNLIPNLGSYKPLLYDGSLSDSKRTRMVDVFQNEDANQVMLLSTKAGNAGITLTRANYVYHFDLWWNPAVATQAMGRVNRIGQTEKIVFERFLLMDNTIERRIHDKLGEKQQLFDEVVDGLSEENLTTTSFTEEEIYGLLGLNKKPKKSKLTVSTPVVEKSNLDIDSLDPRAFEHFVGDLFDKMGYYSRVTKQSGDGGIDIYAKLQTPAGTDEVIIQCKHKQDPSSKVDVAKVRELFGVLSSNRKLSKAFLVTNGGYSKGAIDFATQNGIELIDGAKLLGLVERMKP